VTGKEENIFLDRIQNKFDSQERELISQKTFRIISIYPQSVQFKLTLNKKASKKIFFLLKLNSREKSDLAFYEAFTAH
jgi:hypothetical protein